VSIPVDPRQRARARRAAGVVSDFDGARLALGRRLRGMPRTRLAEQAEVSAAAITQFERGDARPTSPVLAAIALALQFPREFFLRGATIERIPTSAAYFRSLRSTSALVRDQALAFAELAAAVVEAIEQYVELPAIRVPTHPVEEPQNPDDIAAAAAEARRELELGAGPIGHVVRTMEAAGIVVLELPEEYDTARGLDAFSSSHTARPVALLSDSKHDKARSRFDAAHELGHLVMHPDAEPGSKLMEDDAHAFAAQFLAPDAELVPHLPTRFEWGPLLELKRHWGVSVKSLAFRAHRSGRWSDAQYRRAMQTLASEGPGERGGLGPREEPAMLGRAAALLEGAGWDLDDIAKSCHLPTGAVRQVITAGTERRPRLQL
jgi:Zn-dependent peptidase ImmA (M78 family)/DNA-binding XRE family transcriptional regulator